MMHRCAIGTMAGWLLSCSGLQAAELSVNNVRMVQGASADVVVSGVISGESTFGVTIRLEVAPQTGAVGTVEFTPTPPVDIAQLGDPWPEEGTFSAFDTDLAMSSTVNATVDDDGDFVPMLVTFSGALASFPVVASADALGVWDVSLSTSRGDSSWQSLPTTLVAGTITVCPATDPPSQPEGEAGFAKNRYISLVPGSPGTQTAIRVTLTATDIVEFEDAIGRQWWIGPPTEYCENSGQESPPCSSPPVSFMGVRLHKCAPYVADWDALLGSGVALYVFGSRVVPASTYEIQAIHVDCDPGDESNFSAPLVVTTSIWGDVAGRFVGGQWQAPDGSVDVSKDVTAMLDKFRNLDGAPIKARCDIEPELVDQLVNISDVDYVSDAYRGFPYPFSEPQACREGGGGEPPPSGD